MTAAELAAVEQRTGRARHSEPATGRQRHDLRRNQSWDFLSFFVKGGVAAGGDDLRQAAAGKRERPGAGAHPLEGHPLDYDGPSNKGLEERDILSLQQADSGMIFAGTNHGIFYLSSLKVGWLPAAMIYGKRPPESEKGPAAT